MSVPRQNAAFSRSPSLKAPRLIATLAGVAMSAVVLAACGVSVTPTTTTPTTTPTTAATTTTLGNSADAAVAANWRAFFNGQTSATQKIALLQNGSAFSTIINTQASSGLAQSVRATVSAVSILGQTANVRYSITLGGQTALANVNGEAVNQSGVWKVSDASFCVLLGLEGTKSPSCPKS